MSTPLHRRPGLLAFVAIALLVGLWLNRHEILDAGRPTEPVAALDLNHPVVMFGTSWCPYCAKARAWFDDNQVEYVEYNVEQNPAAAAQYRRLRGRGTPLIVIGDEVVRGFAPLQMELAVRVLREVGKTSGSATVPESKSE